jgi:hypothetical protein
MNSILNKDNLGTTKNWKFLRDDLLSIFAADDDRLNKEYENGEIEQVFDQMAEEYLDGFTVSGFCLDANDSIIDVVTLITVLAGASIYNIHPFGWHTIMEYDDEGNIRNILKPNTPCSVPDIFMIDFSRAENFNEEFKRTLDEYMTLFGYGHMDTVYEQRLVYIFKLSYAFKTKETLDIIDSVNNRFYTLKFDPYKFDLLLDKRIHIMSVLASVLLMEIAVSHVCGGKETFRIQSSRNLDIIRDYMCDIANVVTGNAQHTPGAPKDRVICNRASEPEYTEFVITTITD